MDETTLPGFATEVVDKIDSLTAEQEALMPILRDEWIDRCIGGDDDIDEEQARAGVDFLYSLVNLPPPPEMRVCDSPYAALKMLKELGEDVSSTHRLGLGPSAYWVAFHDFFYRIGLKTIREDEGFKKIRGFLYSGVWDSILFEEMAIVIRRPTFVKKDSEGRMHCADGPSIAWRDGAALYFWHGVQVPKQLIMTPETVTGEQILGVKNSEVARAVSEKLGWDEYLRRTGASVIDTWTDDRTKLRYELLELKQAKNWTLMPKLLKMQSPELNDGSQPFYVEPVDPGCKTAKAARRWQFPNPDGSFLTPEQCNEKPDFNFVEEA